MHRAGVLGGKHNNILCIIVKIQILLLLGGESGCPLRNRLWNSKFEVKKKNSLEWDIYCSSRLTLEKLVNEITDGGKGIFWKYEADVVGTESDIYYHSVSMSMVYSLLDVGNLF